MNQKTSKPSDNEEPDNSAVQKREQLINVFLYGLVAGYFFRYGLNLQSEGNDLGLALSAAGAVVGIFFVFPIKPFWRSVVAVAIGIGVADIAILFD